jgi:hypothetical protein
LEEQKKRLREIATENKRKIREQWEKKNPDYEFGLSFGLEKQDWVSKEEARKMEEMERDM